MYQARVEQINGVNVRAGGKWLRCIGNKNVRVGDLIWTDGRCVFGYDKVSQTPLVITAPKTEKIFLPFSIKKNSTENVMRYYRLPLNDFSDFKETKLEDSYKLGSFFSYGFVNNSKGDYYVFETSNWSRVIAAHATNSGDLYTIVSAHAYRKKSGYQLIEYPVYQIFIKKNDQIIKKFDIYQIVDARKEYPRELAKSSIEPQLYYTGSVDFSNTVWGFIENEDNWAFIVLINVGGGCYSEASWYFDQTMTLLSSADLVRGLYADSKTGTLSEIYSYTFAERLFEGEPGPVDHGESVHVTTANSTDVTPLKKLKLPCQDGYYLSIEDLITPPADDVAMPRYGVFSIYRSNKKICNNFMAPLFPQVNAININGRDIISIIYSATRRNASGFDFYPIGFQSDPVLNAIFTHLSNTIFTVENQTLNFTTSYWSSFWLQTTKAERVKRIHYIDVEGIDLN